MTYLAIMLQLCPLDQDQAIALTELICAIEPEPRADIEFIFALRRDVAPETEKYLLNVARKKFANVAAIRSQRWGQKWPQGPNDLWQDTMMQLGDRRMFGQFKADAVLTFEPDCCPMRPDWLDRMKAEWIATRDEGLLLCGSLVSEGDTWEHINGNAIFDIAIMRKYPQLCAAKGGWDTWHRKLLVPLARPSLAVEQRYNYKAEMTPGEFHTIRGSWRQPALLHGVKNLSSINIARGLVEAGQFFKPDQSKLHTITGEPALRYEFPARLALAIRGEPKEITEYLNLLAGLEPGIIHDLELIVFADVKPHATYPRQYTAVVTGAGEPEDYRHDAMLTVADLHAQGKLTAPAVLFLTPDVYPLRADWRTALLAEWGAAQTLGKLIAGHYDEGESLNPCALYDPQIISKRPDLMLLTNAGKKSQRNEQATRAYTFETNAIYNIYPLRYAGAQQIAGLRKNGESPVLLCGIVGAGAKAACREILTNR